MGIIHPFFLGGGQEKGLRAGTENTPMIVGLGKAADLVSTRMEKDAEMELLRYNRDQLASLLKVKLSAVYYWR